MKKKIWIVTPIFIIFALFMIAMSLVTMQFNFTIGVIELSVSIVAVVAIWLFSVRFHNHLQSMAVNIFSNVKDANTAYLEKFKMPVCVVGIHDEIIWCNTVFAKEFKSGKNPIGDMASLYFPNKKLEDIVNNDGTSIKFELKKYTVFGNEIDGGAVLYFIDDTAYKNIALEYSRSRPTVAMIVFDNMEEFVDSNEDEGAHIVLSVENTLQKFAASNKALYKKLSDGRYMIIFQERNIQKLIGEKFKILDEVRQIKLREKEATISVGIGRNANSVKESEIKARMALDMALGRGGDQVAVNSSDNYEFFGGVSQGVEKRSKVRTRVISNSLTLSVQNSDKVLIMGHKFSDLDCVGASIGLHCAITRGLSKPAYIVIDKEKTMATPLIEMFSSSEHEGMFIRSEDAARFVTDKTLLIIVDTHSPSFLENEALYEACNTVVVIDHHRKMVNYINNAFIFYHETTASSACEMCTEIISYMADKSLTPNVAEALLAGIMLDTKNFIMKTGVRTFEAAGYLRRKGADTVSVKRLFADNINTYKDRYKLVSNAEIYKSCAIVAAPDGIEDPRLVSAQAADELLGVKGVLASFVIFMTKDVANISARSYGKINVQVIMEKLGGGGHQTMAATQINNSNLDEVKQRLLETIDFFIDDNKNT